MSMAQKMLGVYVDMTNGMRDISGSKAVIKELFNSMGAERAIKALQKIGVEGDDLKTVLEACGIGVEGVEAALAKSSKTGVGFVGKLKAGFDGLAGTLGMTSGALLGWIGGITAAVTAVTIINKVIQQQKQYLLDCVNASNEAAESWNTQSAAVQSHISRIEELDQKISIGNMTEEESYAVKSELYSIQQDLIASYGSQAEAIDLVNGKLDEEIEKIENLTAAEAQRAYNENYTGIQESIKQMEKDRLYSLGTIEPWRIGKGASSLGDIFDKYKEFISYSDTSEFRDGTEYTIHFTGNASEAYDVLNDLMTDIENASKDFENSDVLNGFLKNLSAQIVNAKDTLDTYGGTYEWQKQLILAKDTDIFESGEEAKTAAAWVADLEEKVRNYNEALASGDPAQISRAAIAFNDVKSAIESASNESGDTVFSLYKVQIQDVLEKLNELAVNKNEFTKALGGDSSVLGRDIKQYADEIKKLKLDDIDLFAMLHSAGDQAGESQLNSLIDAAIDLNYISNRTPESIQKVVDILVQLGVVSGQASQAVTSTGVSFKTALGSVSESIDNTQSKITTLSGALTSLRDGSMSLEQVIDLIQQFPELAEYVDLTAEGFGDLAEGIEELIRNSPKEVIEELQKLKETEGYTEKQIAAIDGLCASFEKLSTDAIQDASGQFGVLAEAINGAKQAKTELDKALQEEEHDAGYEARVSAFTGMKEVMASGEYGSKAYAAYKEYFGLEVRSAADVQKWMNANSKYFTEGKEGVTAFLQQIEALNKAGKLSEDIAFYDGATGELRYDINYLEEFADSLDWSEEMLQDFINKYRMYCEDWTERTTEMSRHELFNKGLAVNVDGDKAIASLDQLMAYTHMNEEEVIALVNEINQFYNDAVSELKEISEGGNVDLTMRPIVDTSELVKAGWDVAAGESATVFSSTFTDTAGTIAANFTPIMVDGNGNYIDTMSEDDLTAYAEGVLDGVHDDYLKLQIGAEFSGKDAVDQAVAEAERIHDLHALMLDGGEIQIVGVDQIHVTQEMVDALAATKKNAEEAKAAIAALANADGITFDSGITYKGRSVEDIVAESVDDSGAVSVDVKMNVNGEEVTQTITTTADTIKGILGEDWEVKLNSSTAEEKFTSLQALATSLVEGSYTVTVGEKTSAASTALTNLISLLNEVQALSTINITASASGNGIQHNATGTKNAKEGPSLLGDEYSPTGQPKPELVVTKDNAYIAGQNGPEIGYLNDGDIVYTADQTKEILNGPQDNVKSIMPRYAIGKNNSHLLYYYAEGGERKLAGSFGSVGGSGGSSNYTTGPSGGKPGLPPISPNKPTNTGSNNGGSNKSSAAVKKTFEELYKEHQHLLAMEQETDEEYLSWLEKAYEDAYKSGEIELDDYRKYAEEVYELQKSLFQDSLGDIEHNISILERSAGNEQKIINMYLDMIQMVESEMQKAKKRGLDENSDYIQELQDQYYSYQDAIKEIQDESTEDAKDSLEDLIDYRIDMLKKDLENEKDALDDKRDALKDFYDDQKEMLQDLYDEEKYLDEQSEKRKAKSDIQAELEQLKFDDSAWAQKRKLELQEELAEADKELTDFEKDHALENTQDLLDKLYEQQEAQIESEIEAIEEKLNDPEALYNRALKDIQNNTLALYEEMVEYNNSYGSGNPEDIKVMWDEAKASLDRYMSTFGEAYKDIVLVSSPDGYASGTTNASPGPKRVDEIGSEWLFTSSNGDKYRVFSGGEKVLNAKATDFLYSFATSGGHVLTNLFAGLIKSMNLGAIGSQSQQVSLSTGDVVIHGSATDHTVSEIRRAQRENIDYILKEFTRLNR